MQENVIEKTKRSAEPLQPAKTADKSVVHLQQQPIGGHLNRKKGKHVSPKDKDDAADINNNSEEAQAIHSNVKIRHDQPVLRRNHVTSKRQQLGSRVNGIKYPAGPQPMNVHRAPQPQNQNAIDVQRGPHMNSHRQKVHGSENDYLSMLDQVAIETSASKNKVTIVTIIDKQYLKLLENFDLFMKRIKLPKYLAISLDKESYARLTELGVNTVYDPSVEKDTLQRSGFLSSEFKKKSAMKFKVLLYALKRGYAALLLDIDVILVKDPFSYLTCSECDIEVQDNIPPHLWYKPSSKEDLYCIGFVFVRRTQSTISLVESVYQRLLSNPKLWDQVEFNKQAKQLVREKLLRVKRLDFDQFPFGDPYFLEHYLDPNPLSTVVAYHINWMKDYVEKIYRAKEMALWLVDENGYYSNKNARYLAYDNPLPELRNREWGSLVLAFKLAKKLNRILILPRFNCPKKTMNTRWPIFCKYRPIGQCYCSLNEITNIEKTPLLNTNPWREHIFLSHASVPRSVKDSVSDVLLVQNEIVDKHPGLYEGSDHILHSHNQKTGPTFSEMITFLKPFENLSVLRFRALYGSFNI